MPSRAWRNSSCGCFAIFGAARVGGLGAFKALAIPTPVLLLRNSMSVVSLPKKRPSVTNCQSVPGSRSRGSLFIFRSFPAVAPPVTAYYIDKLEDAVNAGVAMARKRAFSSDCQADRARPQAYRAVEGMPVRPRTVSERPQCTRSAFKGG